MAETKYDLKLVARKKSAKQLSVSQLVTLARRGELTPEDLIAPTGTSQWESVMSLASIATILGASASHADSDWGDTDDEFEDDSGPSRKKSRWQIEEIGIDMMPMIDVTFQLLIFFMLTNAAANPSIMDVPRAEYGKGVNVELQQIILVDENDNYALGKDGDHVGELSELMAAVTANAQASTKPVDIIVFAHKAASHGSVRELVDRLGNIANVGKINLGVEEPQ